MCDRGQPAFAEGDHDIQKEALDAVDSVARKQHAVVGPEQAALVDGRYVDPVRLGFKAVFDLGRVDSNVVVVFGPPQGWTSSTANM